MAQWKKSLSEVTDLWKMYQNGLEFQIRHGLRDGIPKYVDFYEGRQWPAPTENTKNLPRPVVNIVKMICRSKKSAILSTPVRIYYKSFSPFTNTDKFNAFADSVLRELGQSELDRLAIDDGIKKGSYFYHYYWDSEAFSLDGKRDGGVRCELIDPLNIFFSNPSILDEQKQEWILISSRRSLKEIISLADNGNCLSQLELEVDGDEGSVSEINDKFLTLLTRYFRIDGEVWCERATKGTQINKPFKIAPSLDSFSFISDEKSAEPFVPCGTAPLYPVVCGFYERREGSIYGLSEIEGLIPNQKAINFNIAMELLNVQECAWGKYIALPNALKGQKISNSPGQILIDYSGTGEGIKKMQESNLSNLPMSLSTSLSELTRSVSGASALMTGEGYNTNMSGAAIAYLQAQAQLPIEELKNNFFAVKIKQGKVLAQFMKLYYFDKPFTYKKATQGGKEEELLDVFSSKEFSDSIFEISVEAIGGTRASVASDITLLDTCLKNGSISLETYIKAYPESAITNKQAILRELELEKSSEIERLKKEIATLKEEARGK